MSVNIERIMNIFSRSMYKCIDNIQYEIDTQKGIIQFKQSIDEDVTVDLFSYNLQEERLYFYEDVHFDIETKKLYAIVKSCNWLYFYIKQYEIDLRYKSNFSYA